MDMIKRCWAEVSLDALLGNLNRIKQLTSSDILCVVKSNAYGHGDEAIVNTLQDAGVNYFAVASMNEAVHLRKSGCTKEILLLGGYLSDCFSAALENDITLAVYDVDFARELSDFALSYGKKAKVHIKLNTGMTRIGFDCVDTCTDDILDEIGQVVKLRGLEVLGAFTHFSVSDEEFGGEYTIAQLDRVLDLKDRLARAGIVIPLWHTSNSGAIVNYRSSHLDLVRAGILLYGLYNGFGAVDGFMPVLSLKSVVTQIREIKKGTGISYGLTFVAERNMRVATVSIGYADGYPRSMSNVGKMLVNGKPASVVGRVCMDQTMIDVTDVCCDVGDIVTVIGTDGENNVSASDIAVADGTINYEIVCRISSRVPRLYIKDGMIEKIKEYM